MLEWVAISFSRILGRSLGQGLNPRLLNWQEDSLRLGHLESPLKNRLTLKHIHTYIYVFIHTHTYIYMCVCVYICIYTHIRRKWQFTPVLLPRKFQEEPGGLQSMGSQRVGHNWATSLSLSLYIYTHTHIYINIFRITKNFWKLRLGNNLDTSSRTKR